MKCYHVILIYSDTYFIIKISREFILIIIIIYGTVPNKNMKSHISNYDLCLLMYRIA
jgi:hypothetical protein